MVLNDCSTELLTIGHGDLPLDEFVALLSSHAAEVIADVRTQPYSRYVPEYNRDVLETVLPRHGIRYEFWGGDLGGRPDDPSVLDASGKPDYDLMAEQLPFGAALERLAAAAAERKTCMLCSEEDPCHCHRSSLLGRALAQMGVAVLHIRRNGTTETQEHVWQRQTKGQLTLF
ncbi:MAG: DUF488 domain-containing protein [Planctomycetota bacterium]